MIKGLKFLFKGFFIATLVAAMVPTLHAQQKKPLDIHGLQPGMITREIILHSHAPLDTVLWNGEDGANIIAFRGAYLSDSGQVKVNVNQNTVTQISFVSEERTPEENDRIVQKMIASITTLLGKPSDQYHNVYRIVTWDSGSEELTLTTTDRGRLYSINLTAPHPMSTPGPDPVRVPKAGK